MSDEELRDYSESQNEEWGRPEEARYGDFIGLVYRYKEDESQWNRWFLRNGKTLLFITYNASPRSQLLEHEAVERILATLRAESAA